MMDMGRRFVLREIPKVLYGSVIEDEYGILVLESELKRRLLEIRFLLIKPQTEINWFTVFSILLHGDDGEKP